MSMIYNIKKIDDDTISHQLIDKSTGKITEIGVEEGISQIENLKEHLQDWVNQRRQIKALNIKFVKNDFGFKIR